MLDEFITLYLADLLNYSGSKAEHGVHICRLIDPLCKQTLFIKCKKCEFGKDSVKYLGHIVGQGHVAIDPSKVQAITKFLALIYTKHIQ